MIDGDGDLTIKRPKYPQCEIRVTCGIKPITLKKWIKKFLNCGVGIIKVDQKLLLPGSKKDYTTVYRLFFKVSLKNNEILKKFLLPNLTIFHKKQRLYLILNYLDKKISKHQVFNLYKKTLLNMPTWQNGYATDFKMKVDAAELVC